MSITDEMSPVLQAIEGAYAGAHAMYHDVKDWGEEEWDDIDAAFTAAQAEIARLTGDGAALREQLAERTAERDEYAFSLDQAMPGRTEMIRIVKAAVGELATARERLTAGVEREAIIVETLLWYGDPSHYERHGVMLQTSGAALEDRGQRARDLLRFLAPAPANVAPAAVSEDRK